ncbi:flagellar protein FliT [Piscirickettsia salmonis]|uniref:flagellar protein FliT n=1 Tax=Piscirickettsia salmonis TaxID=1238 RepID=UPI0007C99018|nr:Flagellar protein FliT [Piscirickettsiaceae bacterium NZ-RLO1]
MSIREDLAELKIIMENMLLKAEEGEWESLIDMDMQRSKCISKVVDYSDSHPDPSLAGGLEENLMEEIELLMELDKQIMKICLNRKEDITKNLCDANKAMKGMNEYLKNS